MKFANATNLNRKSEGSEAEGSAVLRMETRNTMVKQNSHLACSRPNEPESWVRACSPSQAKEGLNG